MLFINGICLIRLYDVKHTDYDSLTYTGAIQTNHGMLSDVFWQDQIIWKSKNDPYLQVLIRDIQPKTIEVEFMQMKNVIIPKEEVIEYERHAI
jgi:hypothetical protein